MISDDSAKAAHFLSCLKKCWNALRKRLPLLLPVIFASLVGLFVVKYAQEPLLEVLAWFNEAGYLGCILYIFFVMLWLTLLLPKTSTFLLSGFIYGWLGIPVAICAGMLAAIVSFLIVASVRPCGLIPSDLSKRLRNRYEELSLLGDLMTIRPYRTLILARLLYIATPVKNYGLSVLGVPFLPYCVATFVSTTLYAIPMVYTGLMISNVKEVFTDGNKKVAIMKILPSIVAGGITVILVLVFVRLLRARLMDEATQARQNEVIPVEKDGTHTTNRE